MQLIYKKATILELDKIFDIVQKAIKNMENQSIFQWDEFYPDKNILQEDIEKKELYCVVNELDQIVAFFVLNTDCDEEYKNGKWLQPETDFLVIHRLCVNVDFQNQGIAKQVVTDIEKKAINLNKKSIRLDCFTQNPYSQKLYNKFGYKTVGFVHWRKGEFLLMEKIL